MKRTVLLFLLIVAGLTMLLNNSFGQSPQLINYQAVARNTGGQLIVNQNISVRIGILIGSPTGTTEYSETHAVTTNQFGIFTVQIGGGTVVSGSFSSINWSNSGHFVKVEADETGGSNYQLVGTSQLVSVPYALYANKAKIAEQYTETDTMLWKKNGNKIYYNNGSIGIGISNPKGALCVNGNVGVNSDSCHAIFYNRNYVLGSPQLKLYSTANISGAAYGINVTKTGLSGDGDLVINEYGGKVGIGTANPKNILYVKKISSGSSGITANYGFSVSANDSSISSGVYIGDWGFGGYGAIQTCNQPLVLNPNCNNVGIGTINPLGKFHVNNDKIGSDSSFVILNNGNVGIGTIAPNSKLEVNGTIHSTTGGFKFPDGTTQTTAASAGSGVPAGSIMPFAGTTAPTGYLLCDGSAVSRTTYAALFAAMGTAYGSGDGSTTYNLPDLRGRFLRGVDGTAGSDPDKTSRTASGTGGNTGNNVGSLQGNSIASHSHALLINLNAGSAYGSSVTYLAGGTQNSEPFWYTFSNSSNTVSIQSSGGNETRPINVYVNYIIKY